MTVDYCDRDVICRAMDILVPRKQIGVDILAPTS